MSPASIEWAQLGAVIFFACTVGGVMWAIWFRIEGKVDKAKSEAVEKATAAAAEAASVRADLAAHRLHCSEVFATKQGMHEQTSQLLRAIEGVGNRIEALNDRLDRAFEVRPRA